jgi:hypothetical protein
LEFSSIFIFLLRRDRGLRDTNQSGQDGDDLRGADRESAVVRKTESTERRTETRQEGGLISGTVDIVGKTVALPFKVVGGLIDVIF